MRPIIALQIVGLVSLGLHAVGKSSMNVRAESGADSSQATIASPQKKEPFFANGRIEAATPSGQLKLAEENEIPLRIHTQGLTRLHVTQSSYQGDLTGPESSWVLSSITGGESDVPVQFHSDGAAYIRFIPLRLGHIKFDMWGQYPDGGIVRISLVLSVELPSRSPKRIIVGDEIGTPPGAVPVMFAFLNPKRRRNERHWVRIRAEYDGVTDLVPIDGKFAAFKIRKSSRPSVIEFDSSTGAFRPLNLGEVVIETTFGGWRALTCIDVEDRFNFDVIRPDGCKTLLSPGEKLATPMPALQ
jgi:hypothetical protein